MKNFLRLLFVVVLSSLLISCSSTASSEAVISEPVEEESAELTDVPAEEPSEETIPTEEETTWTASSPVVEFTDEDIAYLGIACSGSDEEIANCIEDWQRENFEFCIDSSGEDTIPECSLFLEYNEILPGILTTKDVIYDKMIDGKIAGICLDYAAVYCSVAEYHGLECRLMRSTNHFCDEVYCDEEDLPGWELIDYLVIEPLLIENDLNFSLEAFNFVSEDTWAHYWAEVLIDGEWEFRDASARDTAQRYSSGEVVIVDWTEMDKSDEMTAFIAE